MNKRAKQNRYTPRAGDKQINHRKWLVWALAILVILLLIELLKPAFHHTSASIDNKPAPAIQKDAPTFEFYKVLPKVSLNEAHLDNLSSTTQPLPTPQKTSASSNATYSLQFASLKDVDQAAALAAKINRIKGLGKHQAEATLSNQSGSTWYVVKIGPFKSRDAAENIQDILDRHYLSGRIFVNQK